jgi:hypothetical protein
MTTPDGAAGMPAPDGATGRPGPGGPGGTAAAIERAHRFVVAVRRAGVAAGPDRAQAFLRALDTLGPGGLYWAGRLTLCAGPSDLARYDAAWRELTGGPVDRHPPGRPPQPGRLLARPGAGEQSGGEPGPGGGQLPVAARASARELLRHRDFAGLTAAERAEVHRLLSMLAPAASLRVTRRRRSAPRGRVDARRTVRATLDSLGEPARLWRRRPARRPRRLVLLLDVSGSMAPYADALLRFAHAAVRVRPAGTEVFTIGTRLTRVSAELRLRDPAAAVRAAGDRVPDWRGGTRLGDALTGFLRVHGHRGMARGATVVVCSDGWETGDPARLAAAAAWLSRLAHRVVWVTPHAGRQGFAPSTAGLAAVLPHLDHLVAGHSLAALAELAEVIRTGAPARPG